VALAIFLVGVPSLSSASLLIAAIVTAVDNRKKAKTARETRQNKES